MDPSGAPQLAQSRTEGVALALLPFLPFVPFPLLGGVGVVPPRPPPPPSPGPPGPPVEVEAIGGGLTDTALHTAAGMVLKSWSESCSFLCSESESV